LIDKEKLIKEIKENLSKISAKIYHTKQSLLIVKMASENAELINRSDCKKLFRIIYDQSFDYLLLSLRTIFEPEKRYPLNSVWGVLEKIKGYSFIEIYPLWDSEKKLYKDVTGQKITDNLLKFFKEELLNKTKMLKKIKEVADKKIAHNESGIEEKIYTFNLNEINNIIVFAENFIKIIKKILLQNSFCGSEEIDFFENPKEFSFDEDVYQSLKKILTQIK
jgi:hypothetical protein